MIRREFTANIIKTVSGYGERGVNPHFTGIWGAWFCVRIVGTITIDGVDHVPTHSTTVEIRASAHNP